MKQRFLATAVRSELSTILLVYERMGFAAIALESGFTESISVRSFVEGGEGDAETAARTALSSGFGRYEENRELIQWMRDYNATASSAGHRRIRFYGIDLAAGARVSGPRRAAIAKAVQKSRKSLIARSSGEEYRWALHNLDEARQLAKCLSLTPPESADKSAWVPTFECRNSAMAENVQWVLENESRHRAGSSYSLTTIMS